MTDTLWPPTESTSNRRNTVQTFDSPCNYIVHKKPLGQGSYSSVFECKHINTKKHYAAKRYDKALVFGLEDMLQNEFSILKTISLGHKNLLNLVDYFETEKYIYLVTSLAKGGELFDRIVNNAISRLSEIDTFKITGQLVDTIDYLHSNDIVHRDIKPENILFQSYNRNQILVADFGLARIVHHNEQLYDKCGTLSYMAPEMLDRKGYSHAVDIWALGVTVYFMLCGYMPFDCETDEETTNAIKTGDYMFEPEEYWNHISSPAKDFIKRCFVVDPQERMTASEAAIHPFLTTSYASSSIATNYSSYMNLNSLGSNSTSISNITAANTLNTSASNVSLFNKLRESLQTIQNTPGDERVPTIAYSTTCSTSSLNLAKGALCESPPTISKFNTPIHSTGISRVQSIDQISFPSALSTEKIKNESIFYI